jgi:hypothetical protein
MFLLGNIWLSKWTDDPVMNSVETRNDSRIVQERNIYFLGSYFGFGLGQSMFIP